MMSEDVLARELASRQKQVWQLQEELGKAKFCLARLDIERDMLRLQLQNAAEQIAELERTNERKRRTAHRGE